MTETKAMSDDRNASDRNVGERRERQKRNRRAGYYVVLASLGGVVGFVFGLYESDAPIWAGGNIPSHIAVILAVITVVAMLGGCLFLKSRVDEVELQNNLYAGAWAAMVVLIGYPPWYLLWKGQLLPEPSHIAMFLTLYGVLTIAYLYRKFR